MSHCPSKAARARARENPIIRAAANDISMKFRGPRADHGAHELVKRAAAGRNGLAICMGAQRTGLIEIEKERGARARELSLHTPKLNFSPSRSARALFYNVVYTFCELDL